MSKTRSDDACTGCTAQRGSTESRRDRESPHLPCLICLSVVTVFFSPVGSRKRLCTHPRFTKRLTQKRGAAGRKVLNERVPLREPKQRCEQHTRTKVGAVSCCIVLLLLHGHGRKRCREKTRQGNHRGGVHICDNIAPANRRHRLERNRRNSQIKCLFVMTKAGEIIKKSDCRSM